jgi:hypothetical protein
VAQSLFDGYKTYSNALDLKEGGEIVRGNIPAEWNGGRKGRVQSAMVWMVKGNYKFKPPKLNLQCEEMRCEKDGTAQ